MASKRSRRRGDRRRRKDDRSRQDGHVQECRKERRRQRIKGCRDYKQHERKRRGEGRAKGIGIRQLANLIRDTLAECRG